MKRRCIAPTKVFALLLTASFLFPTLGGCGPTAQEDSALRIGVAVYRGDDTYISNMTAALQQCAASYPWDSATIEQERQIYVSVADALEDQDTQNGQIDRFLSLDYDVLCVNLVDRTNAGRIVEKARADNVPVVFFNREPVLEDLKTYENLYYVGSDARESARLQAKIVLDLWNSHPEALDLNGDGVIQYVMLEGESRHQDAIIRTEVSVQTLKAGGVPLERVGGGIADWDRSQAAALAVGCFESLPGGIDLILCNNDDMALGAADAANQLGLDFHNIVGIDGTPQGLEAVDAGQLLGTVVMDFEAHGEAIFQLALALALGEAPDALVLNNTHGDVVPVAEDRSVRIPMQVYRVESDLF